MDGLLRFQGIAGAKMRFASRVVRRQGLPENAERGLVMGFYLITIEQAWITAGGRCQCMRLSHGHDNARCNRQLVLENRDCDGAGSWSAHHIDPKGGDILSNCEILCGECKEKIDGTEVEPSGKFGANSG